MTKNKCSSCGLKKACGNTKTSWIFFFIGLGATIAMRAIEPLRDLNPLLGKTAWYMGVGGFLLFFIYKYMGLKKQSEIIKQTRLKEKLAQGEKLEPSDLILITEIICMQDNWKERTNYAIIFVSSAAVLIIAAYMDFL